MVDPPPAAKLSRRQVQCLRGVADHLDSAQIAVRLGISPHTVDGHLAAAIKQLGAASRRDAVRRSGLMAGEKLTGEIPPVDWEPDPRQHTDPSTVRDSDGRRSYDPGPPIVIDRSVSNRKVSDASKTVSNIFLIAAAVALLILAAPELGKGAQAIANRISAFSNR